MVQERFIAINNGYHYLSGILRMESGRCIAQISRTAGVPIQNMHQLNIQRLKLLMTVRNGFHPREWLAVSFAVAQGATAGIALNRELLG